MGGASVNFVLPFSMDDSLRWWRNRLPAFLSGEVLLFVAEVDGVIAGTGQLALAGQPNGYQRADVAKMLVHRDYRKRGLGAAILPRLRRRRWRWGARRSCSIPERTLPATGFTAGPAGFRSAWFRPMP